jgi:endo-1,4-beta-xylanase
MKLIVFLVLGMGLVFNTSQTGQSGATILSPATLRRFATDRGFYVGAAVNISPLRNSGLYRETLKREFNMLVAENVMKWEVIHPGKTDYAFADGDAIVEFARENDMQVRGHTLLWHQQLPAWLTTGKFTRDELLEIMHEHIQTVVGHYKGQIMAWDVVNEAVSDSAGKLRDSIWLSGIGPEYIDYAFRWAHEADPDALLFYNDYNGEGMGTKANAIYELVKGMKARGVPIDGVGLQMHIGIGSALPPALLTRNIQRLSKLGLQVHITEMDVKIQDSSAPMNERFVAQAKVYQDIARACLNESACTALLTWGFTDQFTWIPGFTHKPDAPLLFDKSYAPKPAYTALLNLLAAEF